jgi:hypothetical protein
LGSAVLGFFRKSTGSVIQDFLKITLKYDKTSSRDEKFHSTFRKLLVKTTVPALGLNHAETQFHLGSNKGYLFDASDVRLNFISWYLFDGSASGGDISQLVRVQFSLLHVDF